MLFTYITIIYSFSNYINLNYFIAFSQNLTTSYTIKLFPYYSYIYIFNKPHANFNTCLTNYNLGILDTYLLIMFISLSVN